jgi:hypothetical protein
MYRVTAEADLAKRVPQMGGAAGPESNYAARKF